MNKQTEEALKMAIESMKWLRMRSPIIYEELEAEKACKEALEQPSQEPVAWMACDLHTSWLTFQKEAVKDAKEIIPLYTHPAPSWQGLSDDEIFELHHKWIINSGNKDTQYDFARAIEQALKEKNAREN